MRVSSKIDLSGIDEVARVEIARKIGRLLSKSTLECDKLAALELARVLADDISVSVRSELSRELQYCRFLPADLTEHILSDINDVALPFLSVNQSVTDDFLLSLIAEQGAEIQAAIASREGLSALVSYTICDIAEEGAVEALMDNDSADVEDRAYRRTLDRFPTNQRLMECMAGRPNFPVALVDRLLFKVGEGYADLLMQRFQLADDFAAYLLGQARRRVFNQALEASSLPEVKSYLRQLNQAGGLNSDMLLAQAQAGNRRLFVAALSELAGVSFEKMSETLEQGGKAALSGVLRQIGVPKPLIGAMLIMF